jgi:RimJ/RimL family protein N-acetyltransferase
MAAEPSPLSSYTLRPAEPGDFDAYMDAFEVVAAEGRWMGAEAPIDRDARRTGFDRAVAGENSVLFLAEAGGAIVGSIYASVSGGVVGLGMFVVSGHRGGGIGSALLEAVIDWGRERGAHKISLGVWPTNHPAIALYARYGFRVEGTRRRHSRRRSGALWDALWMGLVLDRQAAGGPGPAKPERPSIVVPEDGLRSSDGGGIVLREWRRADIPALVAVIDDPEIRRTLPHIPDPYTADDAEEYIAGTRVNLTAGIAIAVAIVVDGALAGSIDLRLDGAIGRTAQMGYWVAAAMRGRGVASTAARMLCDFGFVTLGLRRVEVNAEVTNTASRRVAETAGFELEGVRRAWRTVRGVPTDFALYSRLADPL